MRTRKESTARKQAETPRVEPDPDLLTEEDDLLTEEDLEQIVGGIDRETTPAQDVAWRQGNTRTS